MNRFAIINIILLCSFSIYAQNIELTDLKPFEFINEGKYDKAIEKLEVLTEREHQPELYLAEAFSYYKLGDYKRALEVCKHIEKIKPNLGSELEFKIYLALQNIERAKESLQRNIKSSYQISLFKLLNMEEFAEVYQLGLDQFILNEDLYSKTEKQLYQVERLIYLDRLDQALFLVNKIIDGKQTAYKAYYLKSQIAYLNNNFEESLNEINKSLDIKSSGPEFLSHRIEIYKRLNKYPEALSDINKLIRLQPYSLKNYVLKAELLFKTNQFEETIDLTQQILEVFPNNADILYLNSASYFKMENYFEALKKVNLCFEIKTQKEYFELRGDIYSAINTFEYAIRDYSMYLDIEPYNGEVYLKKGWARFKTGDKRGACSDWEKGKRYGNYDATEYLDKYCR